MNARIKRYKDEIKRIEEHIDWCKSMGDLPEDYADLTDEKQIIEESLKAAIQDLQHKFMPNVVTFNDLLVYLTVQMLLGQLDYDDLFMVKCHWYDGDISNAEESELCNLFEPLIN